MKKIKEWWIGLGKTIKDELTSDSPAKKVQNALYLLLGAFVFAMGDAFFILPMNIISGGVSSLSVISHWIPGMSVIPVNIYVLIYTWFFFLLGLIFIGLKYSIHTLIFTIAYPLFVMLFSYIIQVSVVNGIHIFDVTQVVKDIQISNGGVIPSGTLLPLSYLVSAVIGGLLLGTGIGLCYTGGGSSGGTDVINILLHKFFHIRIGTASFILDLVVICGGFAVNGYNLLASLVGILCAFICSLMIDRVFLGNSQYYMAFVMSPEWEKINQFINRDLGRGTTLLKAQGGYTKNDTVVLDICFDREDYQLILSLIRAVDPNAFVTIIKTNEILGYGFSRDTPKVDLNDVAISPDETRQLIIQAERKRRKTFSKKNDIR